MSDGGGAFSRFVLGGARLGGLAPLLRRQPRSIGAILSLRSVTNVAPTGIGIAARHTITPDHLDAAISGMKRLGYRFVTLDDALERLRVGRKLPLFATVTADLGYRNILREALPVLERHAAPVTVYVAPGLTSGAVDLWWRVLEDIVSRRQEIYLTTPQGRVPVDCSTPRRKLAGYATIREYLATGIAEEQRQTVLRDLAHLAGIDPAAPGREELMDWDELRTISRHPLVAIGAQTVDHFNLRRLPDERAWYEIVDAARIIEMELELKPRHMAYPYGDEASVGPREMELAAAAGYASAVTARQGSLQAAHARNLHALPRLRLDGRQPGMAHLRALLSGVAAAAGVERPAASASAASTSS